MLPGEYIGIEWRLHSPHSDFSLLPFPKTKSDWHYRCFSADAMSTKTRCIAKFA